MELDVFGAILIFVVGVIVRQALSSAYAQNQSLRAMRQAMTTSYRYSTGMMNSPGVDRAASRQTASILFIEDKLTAESARHAAVDRTQYITGAAATYTHMLFYPVDAGETANLPAYDVFINGKQFPFSTMAFRTVELARSCAGAGPCLPECKGDCTPSSIQLYPGNLTCQNASPCPAACGGNCSDTSPQTYPAEWEPNCVGTTRYVACSEPSGCNLAFCPPDPSNPLACDSTSTAVWPSTEQVVGCAKLYDVVPNHPGFPDWCDGETGPCPANNLTAAERFDLNRDGVLGDVPAGVDREKFAWQWFLVAGWDAGQKINPARLFGGGQGGDGGVGTFMPVQNRPLRGDGIILESRDCKESCQESKHASIDVDGDLKRENLMPDTKVVDPTTGVIKSFTVLDRQMGDLDMTRGDSDTGPEPGLAKGMKMYSYVLGGTYLLLEEGRLYNPDFPGQYIRTAQKKDQVDIIERTIQLSNNTGRFCAGGTPNTDAGLWTAQVPNPVEACQNCYSGANIQKTCMDRVKKVILVRSRILDRRGRKWVTNTSGDDSVDFVVPPVP